MNPGIKTKTQIFLRICLTVLILLLALWGVQKKIGEQYNLIEQLKTNFSNLDFKWLALSILSFLCSTLFATYRIFTLTKSHSIPLPYVTLLKNTYIGHLFNPLLMGSTGGDVVRSYYLAKMTTKKTELITVVFLDRFVGISVLVFISIFALFLNRSTPQLNDLFNHVLLFFGLLVIVAGLISSKRVIKKLSFLKIIIPGKKLKEILSKSFATLNETKKHKKALTTAVVCTFFAQILVILSTWMGSQAMLSTPPISLSYFFLFMPIIFTVSAVPISMGGLGVGEILYQALFKIVNVLPGNAVSISLLNRVILLIPTTIGALIYLRPKNLELKDIKQE